MKIFQCGTCGHVEFNQAPEKCLVCRAGREAFQENPEAVRRPADPSALNGAEQKHVPVITLSRECAVSPEGGCINVNVKVGEVPHVMEPEHFITWIDYYLDHKFVSRIWLSPETCHPAATLHLNADSGTVTAIEGCNLHGNWISEATI